MKTLTTLFVLLIALSPRCQQIEGVHLNWMGLLQDISDQSNLAFDNTSMVYFSDSTFREVEPTDPFTWVWNLKKPTGVPGHFETIHLDTAFQIKPADHIDVLCHGVFIFEVECIHDDGRAWRCQGPARVIWSIDVEPCDQLPGLTFSWFDEEDYVTADQLIRAFTSPLWYVTKDYVGKIGDMDSDGDVDVSDLLLFFGVYGQ